MGLRTLTQKLEMGRMNPTSFHALFPHHVFFFFFGHTACGILASQPRIELMPPELEAQSFNHWPAGEVLAGYSERSRSGAVGASG